MKLTRRDFLGASTALAGAFGLQATGLLPAGEALALEAVDGGMPVLWLQAQTCTGCSVSLLNSIYYTTIDDLLLNKLDVDFHPNLMAAAGDSAVAAAEATYQKGGYVLVVEGAIPSGANGEYCYLWKGTKAKDGWSRFAQRARFVIAAGTCASFGGVYAGAPNPTGAAGLPATYGGKRIIKVPGCPTHPDWLVAVIAYILKTNTIPALDSYGRPKEFFSRTVHEQCPLRESDEAERLSQQGCLKELGCNGPRTKADCPKRRWNSPGAGQTGVNWCIGAGTPCYGCTEPGFPDQMSPFFEFEEEDSEHDD